jgi:hypothetical protein
VPAFNSAAIETLDKAKAVCIQRGEEYQDTWSLDNLKTVFLDTALKELSVLSLTPEEKRLLVIASLCDVKLSRLIGEFKSDTFEDAINYIAAFRTWLEEYCSQNLNGPPRG